MECGGIKMNNKPSPDNSIRCSLSLALPLVLDFIMSHRDTNGIQEINRILPDYTFSGIVPSKISPHFVHIDSKNKGKKRVYTNSGGFIILYLRQKVLRRFEKSMKKLYPLHIVNSLIDRLSDRWVMLDGDIPRTDDWCVFASKFVVVESDKSRSNHPPTGFGLFECVDIPQPMSTRISLPYCDFMGLKCGFEKYKLPDMLIC